MWMVILMYEEVREEVTSLKSPAAGGGARGGGVACVGPGPGPSLGLPWACALGPAWTVPATVYSN